MSRDLVHALAFLTGMTVFFVISVNKERDRLAQRRRGALDEEIISVSRDEDFISVQRDEDVRDRIVSVQERLGNNFSYDATLRDNRGQETGAEPIVKVLLLSMARSVSISHFIYEIVFVTDKPISFSAYVPYQHKETVLGQLVPADNPSQRTAHPNGQPVPGQPIPGQPVPTDNPSQQTTRPNGQLVPTDNPSQRITRPNRQPIPTDNSSQRTTRPKI